MKEFLNGERPYMLHEANCKICGLLTRNIFNIHFSAVAICEECADEIFIQQAVWHVSKKSHAPAPKSEKQ